MIPLLLLLTSLRMRLSWGYIMNAKYRLKTTKSKTKSMMLSTVMSAVDGERRRQRGPSKRHRAAGRAA